MIVRDQPEVCSNSSDFQLQSGRCQTTDYKESD
jgi:hypothetical protein